MPDDLLEALPEHLELAGELVYGGPQHELHRLRPALLHAAAGRPPHGPGQRLALVRRVADANDILPGLVRIPRVELVNVVLESPRLPPRWGCDATGLPRGAGGDHLASRQRVPQRGQPRLATEVNPSLFRVGDNHDLLCKLDGVLKQSLDLNAELLEGLRDRALGGVAQDREAVVAHARRGRAHRVVPIQDDNCLVRLMVLGRTVRGLAGQGREVNVELLGPG
mmetsp:Transcript_18663/g.49298  ORF Transcript_18663/g.49298 Transcript_18663/m.49298 type:complete len:223 (+) Transcript_18663:232-900(+)